MDFPPPLAELIAIIEGLNLSISLGCKIISVESDSLQALIYIKGKEEPRSELGSIVAKIRQLVLAFEGISFNFISRNLNSMLTLLQKKQK